MRNVCSCAKTLEPETCCVLCHYECQRRCLTSQGIEACIQTGELLAARMLSAKANNEITPELRF